MLATRRDQENAVHRQQLAGKSDVNKGAPKTPARQPKTPHRNKQSDENLFSVRKVDGKVKDAVAVLENRVAKTNADASIGRTRVPLGTKTANAKGNAFQTPAQPLTRRPVLKHTSPRLRRARFQVHEAEATPAEPEEEVREIEIMHPRGKPLPDHPDEDIWPHDRKYPQLEGVNFAIGWALEFFPQDEELDFDTRMKQFEEAEARKATKVSITKQTISTAKPASSISSVRGVGNFAAATRSSAARAMSRSASRPVASAPPVKRNPRHAVAKMVSNTTLGYARGRETAAAAPKSAGQDFSPITEADRNAVLQEMWYGLTLDDEEILHPQIDVLDLESLRDLDVEIPDD